MINHSQAVENNTPKIEGALLTESILVQKRNGSIANFDSNRIRTAIEKAFRAVRKIPEGQELDPFSNREVKKISDKVINRTISKFSSKKEINIEQIQDLVEISLMQSGHYNVAKGYILYRQERSKARLSEKK